MTFQRWRGKTKTVYDCQVTDHIEYTHAQKDHLSDENSDVNVIIQRKCIDYNVVIYLPDDYNVYPLEMLKAFKILS